MKQALSSFLLTMLMSMLGIKATAHDIEVANSDGVTIYYVWTNNNTELAVSYRGNDFGSYLNEYSGNVVIPKSVTYNGKSYSVTSIGNWAFRNCSGLTSVTIPNSVTSIGKSAFQYCYGLTSVTIPNSVTSIGGEAFYSCSGLTSVTIPNSVTSIGQYAFRNCSGLTSVTIPNSVTSIGANAFYGTGIYNNSPNGVFYVDKWVCGYKGTMQSNSYITLVEGTRGISASAFYDFKNLTSVTIPNSVKSIGDDAFKGCSGLKNITIPNSVTSIGYEAFGGCSVLTSVTIGNSVTSIGDGAFYGCSGLTSITIPNSVTSIGDRTFCECSGLTSVTIPNSVTSIGNRAFCECSGLTAVTIPSSVTSIGESAFEYCSGLTSVTIPSSVTSIARDAFHGCSGLTAVTIPSSVTSIGGSAFSGCSCLMSVTIPNSVTNIGSSAFNGCSGLRSVTIGTGVLSIGQNAFSSPTKVIWLTNTPPDGYRNAEGKVNYVANNQYWFNNNATVYPFLSSLFEVDGVKYVPVSPSERTCDAIDCRYDDSAENIHIGKTVTNKGVTLSVMQVHPYAFYNNLYVKDVDLSFDGNVGNYAFYGCGNINKAVIKNTGNVGDYAFSKITGEEPFSAEINNTGEIGLNAFSGTSLTTLDIGNKVTNIKDNAFNGCTVLKTAMINNKGSLGNSVFQKCTALETATLGENITSLGTYAFDGCSSLKGIDIPNAVKTIGERAFQNCSAMETMKMGTGIKSIETYTFSGCSSLSDMQIGSNVETINTYAFSNCTSLPIIRIPRAVTDIKNSVFYQCGSLKDVIMDDRDKVLNLGSNRKNNYDYGNPLFSDCPLDSVYIGGNISYNTNSNYGYSPFYRNTSLRTVVITDKETEISENEFYGCTNLQDVKIGDGVESFGDWAFSGCSSLKNFSFGMSVETIGKEAFSDCTAMERIYSRSPQPPVCGSQALDDINKWNCVLTVPAGNKAAYQAADQWKEFFFVEEGEAVNKYINITIEKSEGGKVLVNGLETPEQIKKGNDVELQFIPDEGYSLKQVLVNSDDVTAKVAEGKYTVTNANVDLTVKATFSVNQYTLTYLVDGEEYKTLQVDYKATITPEPAPEKEGYTFSGWSEIPETMPAHDVTVNGTFSVNSYTLTYLIDDEVYKTMEVVYGSSITPEAAPTKEGYTFSGWSEIPKTMPAHDVIVTGTFSINKYLLTYIVDGKEYKTYEVEYEASIIPEEEPAKEGYTFSGWSEIPETMPARNVTVNGTFSINSYTLTYMIDEEVYKQVVYEYGATITPEPQPEGDYVSFEWVGVPETMPAHDVTVTAVYETGIAEIMMMAQQGQLRIYSPNGKLLSMLQKGLNIVVLQDGTTKKVVVK